MIRFIPVRRFLQVVSWATGILVAQTLIDQAGLSYSKSAAYELRAPVMVLVYIGGIVVTSMVFAFIELAAEKIGVFRSRVATSVGAFLAVAVCFGAFWAMHTLHMALPYPS